MPLNVDSKNFPDPSKWFNEENLCSEEVYFQKIEQLLSILDKEEPSAITV